MRRRRPLSWPPCALPIVVLLAGIAHAQETTRVSVDSAGVSFTQGLKLVLGH